MKKGFWGERISRYEFIKRGFKLCLGLVLFFLIKDFWTQISTPILTGRKDDNKEFNGLTLTEAMYYSRLPNNKVQCLLCTRKCVLKEGQRGFCNARINKNDKLYSLVYGRVLFHPIPTFQRSLIYCVTDNNILRLGTAGCNMKCKFCLTWQLSQAKPEEVETIYPFNDVDDMTGASPSVCKKTIAMMPEDIINLAEKYNCKVINFNWNEPTIYYEYMLDVAKLAKQKGLINVLSTCGYINQKPLKNLLQYMDGVSLGLKGFTEEMYLKYCSAELKPVLETLKVLKEERIGFEITYVVIPTVNDNLEQIRRMCIWIKKNLGETVPLHFYRFFPSYLLKNLPPTPISTLETVRQIANNEVGLKYVYIFYLGGYPDPNFEDKIYCSNCNRLILCRKGMRNLLVNNTRAGRCVFCGKRVSFVILD